MLASVGIRLGAVCCCFHQRPRCGVVSSQQICRAAVDVAVINDRLQYNNKDPKPKKALLCMVMDQPVARQEGVAGDGYHLYRQHTVSAKFWSKLHN
jgi:hypothetical protein